MKLQGGTTDSCDQTLVVWNVKERQSVGRNSWKAPRAAAEAGETREQKPSSLRAVGSSGQSSRKCQRGVHTTNGPPGASHIPLRKSTCSGFSGSLCPGWEHGRGQRLSSPLRSSHPPAEGFELNFNRKKGFLRVQPVTCSMAGSVQPGLIDCPKLLLGNL